MHENRMISYRIGQYELWSDGSIPKVFLTMSEDFSRYTTALTERSISYLVRQAHRSFVKALAERLAPHDIAVSEWTVLRMLWLQDNITQVELASRMHLQKSSLTSILENLERRHLIVRRRRPEDRRKAYLQLTPEGAHLKAALMPYGVANNERALVGFSDAETEKLQRMLDRLIANLSVR